MVSSILVNSEVSYSANIPPAVFRSPDIAAQWHPNKNNVLLQTRSCLGHSKMPVDRIVYCLAKMEGRMVCFTGE